LLFQDSLDATGSRRARHHGCQDLPVLAKVVLPHQNAKHP
jgi:hypothetical protein